MAKIPRPQKPPVKPLKEGQSLIQEIGLIQERLIGRLIAEWSNLEATMEILIWGFFELEMEYGRIITTKMDATSRIQMIRLLADLSLSAADKDKVIETIDKIDILREDRNFIIHGTWFKLTPDAVPMAFSMRPKHHPTQVVGETFEHNRMRAAIHAIRHLRNELSQYTESLPTKRQLSPRQSDQEEPSSPPNPEDLETK